MSTDLFAILFPYTTLFRSYRLQTLLMLAGDTSVCYSTTKVITNLRVRAQKEVGVLHGTSDTEVTNPVGKRPATINSNYGFCRSEEHTSELQSRENLVCRLL